VRTTGHTPPEPFAHANPAATRPAAAGRYTWPRAKIWPLAETAIANHARMPQTPIPLQRILRAAR